MAQPAAVIVLAAGQGTRMKSKLPKIMHEIGGRSMVGHALAAARTLDPQRLVVVVRHDRDRVAQHVLDFDPQALIADQSDVPGTGSAVLAGLQKLDENAPVEGTVVVTYGDVPLLTADTLRDLVAHHDSRGNAVTVLTAIHPEPGKYGRILRDADGSFADIREFKDANQAERAVAEVNSGIFAFDATVLRDALDKVDVNNAQGEMYLTDVPAIARAEGGLVDALTMGDYMELEGANDRVQLAELGRYLNRRTVESHMRNGVSVIDPATTWIGSDVAIAADAVIHPNTQLHGITSVGEDAVVGPETTLTNVRVGRGAIVVRTHGSDSTLGEGSSVGPFAYLRPGTELGAGGKIGTYVETKNAQIGAGSKVPHLSYVGDATIGEHSNIGAASVFVNYDGVNKHRTTIGNHVRMGSDNMYVAPVTVGDGAYSGASTTVRKDVPAGALALTEGRQVIVENWVLDNRAGTAAADAAQAAQDSTTSHSDARESESR
ncbi:bifunctional UDP-N-acetylglucosamine diphosphorylase/glucosamine-1-phosphate N-acetyltransferase GlmU [Kocuria sp. JC486]|uniref:Bifunctional protein GlmU n=1 Tax=Kocuria soli TaxID=2485125 RepID=A0A3N4ABZ4_9MICC|nr:bifunctional UDP-N-acetylglucosamine diphosphorylase/glucosamine-1-phosphate N-acetyltransferase GlmU [Kocuria sp. JC486]ROZ63362.1 bifunctional UDP-N-acetylglucosamine diphosphorylase/glucosamine-1-phosphate N-acetyltransferase GlmU [Kocuria soli]